MGRLLWYSLEEVGDTDVTVDVVAVETKITVEEAENKTEAVRTIETILAFVKRHMERIESVAKNVGTIVVVKGGEINTETAIVVTRSEIKMDNAVKSEEKIAEVIVERAIKNDVVAIEAANK